MHEVRVHTFTPPLAPPQDHETNCLRSGVTTSSPLRCHLTYHFIAASLAPPQDHEANCLRSGSLQLPKGALLLLDETGLAAGGGGVMLRP